MEEDRDPEGPPTERETLSRSELSRPGPGGSDVPAVSGGRPHSPAITPRLFRAAHVAPPRPSLRMKVGRQERSRDNSSDLGQDPHRPRPRSLRPPRGRRPGPETLLQPSLSSRGGREGRAGPTAAGHFPPCSRTVTTLPAHYEEVITHNPVPSIIQTRPAAEPYEPPRSLTYSIFEAREFALERAVIRP